ncbi:MAG: type II secretion system protein [Abditibacteriota bacterium]|nr:type II secretion system protein [Abditibacteriota bacterium]
MKNIKLGFTLIEVLVVIAVIALLVGILFPVFSSVKAKGRQASCMTNLMEIGVSISMYCADYDQRMIPCISFGNFAKANDPLPGDQLMSGYSFANTPVADGYAWSTILFPYVKNKNTYYCPGSIIEPGDGISTYNTGYAINCNVTGGALNNVSGNGIRVRPPLMRQLKRPAETYLVADGSSYGLFGTVINKYMVNNSCYIPASYGSKADAEEAGITGDFADDATERHQGGKIVVLFADNHADLVPGVTIAQDIENNTTFITGGL